MEPPNSHDDLLSPVVHVHHVRHRPARHRRRYHHVLVRLVLLVDDLYSAVGP